MDRLRCEDSVDLTEREMAVCRAICSADGPATFGAVKGSTSLHQELVSRIIRRLVIHGLVTKVDGGYAGRCSQ